jgi:hypothetical protein
MSILGLEWTSTWIGQTGSPAALGTLVGSRVPVTKRWLCSAVVCLWSCWEGGGGGGREAWGRHVHDQAVVRAFCAVVGFAPSTPPALPVLPSVPTAPPSLAPTAPPVGAEGVMRYVLGMDDGTSYVNLNDVFDSLFASCAIHIRCVGGW